MFRKIREDLQTWERLTVDDQERVVGRRKADSAPFDGGAPLNSHKEKSSVKRHAGEVEVLRRSFPFGSPHEAGLLFVCFVRDLAQYETVKGQMNSQYTNRKKTGGSHRGLLHRRPGRLLLRPAGPGGGLPGGVPVWGMRGKREN